MIDIILIETKQPGNIGAAARIMKNFNQKNIILINPQCSPKDQIAKNRAKHANDILAKAKTKPFSYLKSYDYLVATTAQLGTDYNVPRSPLPPINLAKKISPLIKKKIKIGIMIGRENTGLTNKEIALADFLVTIPSSKQYPTMNMSHALAIILYEIYNATKADSVSSHILFSTKKEKEIIQKYINNILNTLHFPTPSKKQTQKTIWKKIIGKSFLTKREAYAVIGFFKKIQVMIKSKK